MFCAHDAESIVHPAGLVHGDFNISNLVFNEQVTMLNFYYYMHCTVLGAYT